MPHAFSKDLTEGGVTKGLVAFALPLMASTLLQSLYNVADMLIVGLFTDAAGISGVAIGGQVTILVTNVVIGLVTGGTVLIAQYHGAKRFDDERVAVSTTLGACLALSAAVTVGMTVFAGPVMKILSAPPESFVQARDYLRICMSGSVFIFGYNALSAIMRGLGDSKRPLIFVAVAAAVNVALDLFMVGILRMGAAGAAWATVASQALSLVLSIVYLARRGFALGIRINGATLKRLTGIGLPMAAQQFVVQFSFIFLLALINSFGVAASAATGICIKVNSFAILPGLAMLSAVSAMAGQNIGALRYDRALGAMGAALRIIVPVAAAICIAVNLFTRDIIGVFSRDADVIAIGSIYLRFISVDALIASVVFCLLGLLLGAGRTNVTLLNSFLSSIVLRVPLAYVLAKVLGMGIIGLGSAVILGTLGSLAFLSAYVASGKWKRSIIGQGPAAP
jgi:putative MATE family efflux protein